MFAIFDRLTAHLQKSKTKNKNTHNHHNWFLIVVGWLIKKDLDL